MRALLLLLGLLVIIAAIAIGFGFVSVNQTETGSLPELRIEGGSLPSFDASVAKVEVGTQNRTVEVPTVNVQKPGGDN